MSQLLQQQKEELLAKFPHHSQQMGQPNDAHQQRDQEGAQMQEQAQIADQEGQSLNDSNFVNLSSRADGQGYQP
jgi:hypothetical protein